MKCWELSAKMKISLHFTWPFFVWFHFHPHFSKREPPSSAFQFVSSQAPPQKTHKLKRETSQANPTKTQPTFHPPKHLPPPGVPLKQALHTSTSTCCWRFLSKVEPRAPGRGRDHSFLRTTCFVGIYPIIHSKGSQLKEKHLSPHTQDGLSQGWCIQ